MFFCNKTLRTVYWNLLTVAPTQSSHALTDVPTSCAWQGYHGVGRQGHPSIHAERSKAWDYDHHATSSTIIANPQTRHQLQRTTRSGRLVHLPARVTTSTFSEAGGGVGEGG
jgi:hypothetical protein